MVSRYINIASPAMGHVRAPPPELADRPQFGNFYSHRCPVGSDGPVVNTFIHILTVVYLVSSVVQYIIFIYKSL